MHRRTVRHKFDTLSEKWDKWGRRYSSKYQGNLTKHGVYWVRKWNKMCRRCRHRFVSEWGYLDCRIAGECRGAEEGPCLTTEPTL